MQSLQLSFNAVAPIFILLALGYIVKNLKMADKKTFDSMNKLVFTIFLPVLLFYNIYKTENLSVFDTKIIGFILIAVLCIYALAYPIILLFSKDDRKRGVLLQAVFRSNYAILGVPLVSYICQGTETGLSSLMVAIVVPVFNVLAVITLEKFRGGRANIGKMLLGIIKNPLIVGCAFGMFFLLTGIKLPAVIEKSVKDISGVASPLSIFILGASFTFSSMKGYVREIVFSVSLRLVIVPLLAVTAAIFLGFRGESLACLLIVFGTPVAISSFAMTQQMGGDDTLAGHLVVMTSALCLFTLFIWIFALSHLGFF